MPKLATKVTTELTQEVKLSPSVRTKLITQIKAYRELQAQREKIDAEMERKRTEVGKILADSDAQTLHVEGAGTGTWVFPVRSALDKKKFVALGGSLATLESATVSKPGKPYVKITPEKPGN